MSDPAAGRLQCLLNLDDDDDDLTFQGKNIPTNSGQKRREDAEDEIMKLLSSGDEEKNKRLTALLSNDDEDEGHNGIGSGEGERKDASPREEFFDLQTKLKLLVEDDEVEEEEVSNDIVSVSERRLSKENLEKNVEIFDNQRYEQLENYSQNEFITENVASTIAERSISRENPSSGKEEFDLEWEHDGDGADQHLSTPHDEESAGNIIKSNSSAEYVEEEDIPSPVTIPGGSSLLSRPQDPFNVLAIWSCQGQFTYDSIGCSSELVNTFVVNDKSMEVSKQQRAFEYFVRPDIGASTILTLIQQVYLSYGGTTIRADEGQQLEFEHMRRLSTSFQMNNFSELSKVDTYLGVNLLKQRVLIIIFNSSSSNVLQNLVNAGNAATSQKLKSFGEIVSEIHVAVSGALHSEFISINYLLPQSDSVGGGEDILSRSSHQLTLDSVIDPFYVRDLQESFAYDMKREYDRLKSELHGYVSFLEKSIARLMTILKPQYVKAQLKLPDIPSKHALFSQESGIKDANSTNTTSRTDNSHGGSIVPTNEKALLEFSRLLILRARREFLKKQSIHATNNSNNVQMNIVESELYNVLHSILVKLKDKYVEEAKQNSIPRLCLGVAYRLQQIENFKWKLINQLGKRQITSAQDKEQFNSLKSNFRVASENEPCLLECRASMVPSSASFTSTLTNSRIGTIYVTLSHIYFHSPAVMFVGAYQKVIMLSTITSLKVIPATLLMNDAISIVDEGGNEWNFYLSASAPNYAHRMVDLLHVLVGQATNSTSSPLEAELSSTSTENIMNTVEQVCLLGRKIVAKNESLLLKEDDMNLVFETCRNQILMTKQPPPLHKKKDDIDKSSSGSLKSLDFPDKQSLGQQNSQSDVKRTSPLGRNIQAFLDQSQRQSSSSSSNKLLKPLLEETN